MDHFLAFSNSHQSCKHLFLKQQLRSLLPSWPQVKEHRQVVLFAVGLMSNPTSLVDHVYQLYIESKLEHMKNDMYYHRSLVDRDLLKSLYTESKVQLTGNALHNQHINCYDHEQEDQFKRQRDNTSIYIPNKVYEFTHMKEIAMLDTGFDEQQKEITHCALIFINPEKDVIKRLLTKIQMIMEKQVINNLYMDRVKCTDLPQPFMFNIGKNIQLLTLKTCFFPQPTKSHLIKQINQSSTIRKIDLEDTEMKDVASLTLNNKALLTHLNLCRTDMSKQLNLSVCQQVAGLKQLEYLNFSLNDLSHIDTIILSNKPNLSYLNCSTTQMSKKPSRNVINQLGYITGLCHLNLSHNALRGSLSTFLPDPHHGLCELTLFNSGLNKEDLQHISNITQDNKLPNLRSLVLAENGLTGCLSSFLPDPHPGLPELHIFDLARNSLNRADVLSLIHLIQAQKLPELELFELSSNQLSEIETHVERLIETCAAHHQRETPLWLSDNNLTEEFQNKWERRCGQKFNFIF